MKFRIIILIVFTSIINSNVALSASFNCKKASVTVEFSICNNPSLNEADTELGNAYKELKQTLSDEEFIMLRNEQRIWIKQRNTACSSSESCLMSEIESRTQELKRKLDIKKYAESSIPTYTPSYSNRSCDIEMPPLACTPENSDATAVAMCATVMGGCEVIKQKLPESLEKYATSQVCGAMVSKLSGQEYDINAMLYTLGMDGISGVVNSANKSDFMLFNVWGFASKMVLNEMNADVKRQKIKQCINEARKQCSHLYDEWRNKCQ